jgi:methylenetetrahydrofolate reductase (NADPH)
MKLIRDIHAECRAAGRPAISFEFFPPKTEEGDRVLFEKALPALGALRPDYCSVTYGAGGSTRDKTLTIVDRIQREFSLPAMMHLTCVNATREELRAVVEEARARGIRNILALRGDPPGGGAEWTKTEGGFEYSRELVAFLRELDGFSIGTAGFPEGHIACRDGKQTDWRYLRDKVEAGADFIITQLFFDNADFFEFRDHLTRDLGVTVPIIPGILPVLARGQTKKFVTLCGAKLPEAFVARLDEIGDDDAAVTEFGIEYATRQCEELLREGAPGLHFYTLNKAHSTVGIVRNLGFGETGGRST